MLLMLPITPSNFHFFLDKWRKKLDSYDDKNQKNIYAQKISNALRDFGNSEADNALVPYIKKWCDSISHKDLNADMVIKGLNQLEKDDSKLML